MQRKIYFTFLIFLLFIVCSNQAKSFTLSDQAEISVLTCGPTNEVYALYGHTAIRVNDPLHNVDLAFNYGVFSFGAPNFIYRFAKGETDYLLYPYKFNDFFEEYKKDQRSVFEQVLNLTKKEKQQLFDFLIWNAKEENRVYRYSFFFDNCSSRVRDVIENQVDGRIIFPEESADPKTFRQLVKMYHSRDRWLNFGVDLAVCAPADRLATAYEEMFLPDFLMDHFGKAKIEKGNETKPLVSETRTLFEAHVKPSLGFSIVDPFIVFLLINGLIVFISIRQYRKNRISASVDYLVYGMNGFMGIVLLWLVLFSEHPAMSPNYNLLWAMPLNLIFALLWIIKKWRPLTRYYHLFILVWMLLFVLIAGILPQAFHPVFFLFVIGIVSRAALHSAFIIRDRKKEAVV